MTAAERTAFYPTITAKSRLTTAQELVALILRAGADGVQVRVATVARAGLTDEIRDELANCFCLDELE